MQDTYQEIKLIALGIIFVILAFSLHFRGAGENRSRTPAEAVSLSIGPGQPVLGVCNPVINVAQNPEKKCTGGGLRLIPISTDNCEKCVFRIISLKSLAINPVRTLILHSKVPPLNKDVPPLQVC